LAVLVAAGEDSGAAVPPETGNSPLYITMVTFQM
jgi:hypothetical protein